MLPVPVANWMKKGPLSRAEHFLTSTFRKCDLDTEFMQSHYFSNEIESLMVVLNKILKKADHVISVISGLDLHFLAKEASFVRSLAYRDGDFDIKYREGFIDPKTWENVSEPADREYLIYDSLMKMSKIKPFRVLFPLGYSVIDRLESYEKKKITENIFNVHPHKTFLDLFGVVWVESLSTTGNNYRVAFLDGRGTCNCPFSTKFRARADGKQYFHWHFVLYASMMDDPGVYESLMSPPRRPEVNLPRVPSNKSAHRKWGGKKVNGIIVKDGKKNVPLLYYQDVIPYPFLVNLSFNATFALYNYCTENKSLLKKFEDKRISCSKSCNFQCVMDSLCLLLFDNGLEIVDLIRHGCANMLLQSRNAELVTTWISLNENLTHYSDGISGTYLENLRCGKINRCSTIGILGFCLLTGVKCEIALWNGKEVNPVSFDPTNCLRDGVIKIDNRNVKISLFVDEKTGHGVVLCGSGDPVNVLISFSKELCGICNAEPDAEYFGISDIFFPSKVYSTTYQIPGQSLYLADAKDLINCEGKCLQQIQGIHNQYLVCNESSCKKTLHPHCGEKVYTSIGDRYYCQECGDDVFLVPMAIPLDIGERCGYIYKPCSVPGLFCLDAQPDKEKIKAILNIHIRRRDKEGFLLAKETYENSDIIYLTPEFDDRLKSLENKYGRVRNSNMFVKMFAQYRKDVKKAEKQRNIRIMMEEMKKSVEHEEEGEEEGKAKEKQEIIEEIKTDGPFETTEITGDNKRRVKKSDSRQPKRRKITEKLKID